MPLCLIAPLAYTSYAFMVFVLMTPPRYNAPTPTEGHPMTETAEKCSPKCLRELCSTAGFSLWYYDAVDAANCLRPNFFRPVGCLLCVGDIIFVVGRHETGIAGRPPVGAAQLLVTEAGAHTVVVPMCATPRIVS